MYTLFHLTCLLLLTSKPLIAGVIAGARVRRPIGLGIVCSSVTLYTYLRVCAGIAQDGKRTEGLRHPAVRLHHIRPKHDCVFPTRGQTGGKLLRRWDIFDISVT